MKVAVVGSNGRVGSLVVKELLERNYDVVSIAKEETEGVKTLIKDALDLTKEDLNSFDVVIDAVGGWTPETIHNITDVMNHLADLLESSNTRLIVVGGAGSLYVNKERTVTVDMGKDFPDSWKPLSNAHGKGLEKLRNSKDLKWTYNFVADGKRTGEYKLGGENLILNSNGESVISYADYALALVDVIESGKYIKERISVVSK